MVMIDVLIIGSGPAGYTAAIYSARAGYNVKVVTGNQDGGQLTITSEIENYPGFSSPISGPQLMMQMREQVEKTGVDIVYDVIDAVNFEGYPFNCTGESGESYVSRSVIIATGASAKWLGIKSETVYRNRGVSACATCDGFFFKGKPVAVVGGGNTAVEEAIYLTNFASKVYLIHRRDSLRAEKILQQRLFDNSKIEVVWNSEISEVLGDGRKVTGILLSQQDSQRKIDLDGVFIAIGHAPATKIFENQVKLDDNGYIVVDGTKTSVYGVFAAGDVCDSMYRQAIVSAGQGCKAAMDVDKFLSGIH
ncbi:MAG: thioredoxin-disulfide reductase [Alphaproteobacteria bacterium]|nr:thioredoxin-disulfide reductase [Alphaproteobacteria bacterium]